MILGLPQSKGECRAGLSEGVREVGIFPFAAVWNYSPSIYRATVASAFGEGKIHGENDRPLYVYEFGISMKI